MLGSLFAIVGSGVNMFFSMRAPSISISTLIAQLLAHPIGKAWAEFMPKCRLRIFGFEWELNPGSFTIKEHTIVTVMANVSFSVA